MKFRSRAAFWGAALLAAGAASAIFQAQWAVFPLALWILLCMIAPFVPGSDFFLPVIRQCPPEFFLPADSSRARDARTVCLSFDDGPDPFCTPRLLDLLAARNIPAVFFVIGEKAARHPDLIHRMIREGHGVENHSMSHDIGLMLRSMVRLRKEIREARETLEKLGAAPRWFRPPAGVVNPRLGPALAAEGQGCMGWSRRARDGGLRRFRPFAGRLIRSAKSGDILLLHDGSPRSPGEDRRWLKEVESLLDGLTARKMAFACGRLPASPQTGPLTEQDRHYPAVSSKL